MLENMFIHIIFTDIPIIVKSKLEKSLMFSFISSVLKIIRKLDLSTNKSSNEVYKLPLTLVIFITSLFYYYFLA